MSFLSPFFSTQQTQQLGPTAGTQAISPQGQSQAMNSLLLGQLGQGFGTTGTPYFMQPQPNIFSMSPAAQGLYPGALQGLNQSLGPGAAKNWFDTIGVPSAVNNAITAGMGRSGGMGQLVANAGTDAMMKALPYQSGIASNMMNIAQLPSNLNIQDYGMMQQFMGNMLNRTPWTPSTTGATTGAPTTNQTGVTSPGGTQTGLQTLLGLGSALFGQGGLISGLFSGGKPGGGGQPGGGGTATGTSGGGLWNWLTGGNPQPPLNVSTFGSTDPGLGGFGGGATPDFSGFMDLASMPGLGG